MGPTATAEEEIRDEFYDLTFSVNKFCRYHEKLRSFYWGCSDLVKILTVISSSGIAFLLYAEFDIVAVWWSGAIALMALLDITLSPGKKGQTHDAQYRAFKALAGDIRKSKYTDFTLRKLQARRLKIEEDSPP
ncbi:hypothetical protein, partial [Thalassobaculum sp.]|uniref:hypothetical protein n=1 Tax=Thalassobaculum sp. TaxID=2022740 RepID=UPI0032EB6638